MQRRRAPTTTNENCRLAELGEMYDRHAGALYRLALVISRDPGLAEDAVAAVFLAFWRAPGRFGDDEPGLHARLAGEVYTRCVETRGQAAPSLSDTEPAAAFNGLPRLHRDLLALTLLGEHTDRQAAIRVGLGEGDGGPLISAALRRMSDAPRTEDADADQLREALTGRVVIEQAKGVLAERVGIGIDAAFVRLHAYARVHDRRVSDIAREILEGRLGAAEVCAPAAAAQRLQP